MQLAALVLLSLACLTGGSAAVLTGEPTSSMELPPTPTYLVLVPRKFLPDQELRISVTIFRMLYSSFNVRVSLRRTVGESEKELTFASETFKRQSSRVINMKVPQNVQPGNFTVHVEGSVESLGGLVFQNRTSILFEQRSFATFIQFSKPIYAMGRLVRFRVIPYELDLKLRHRVFTSVEVIDPNGVTVRRWLSPRTGPKGFINFEYRLPPTCAFGQWTVRSTLESFKTERNFRVHFNTINSMFSVNVSLPMRLSEFAFGVYGSVQGNHTSNAPAIGNATVRLQLRQDGAAIGEMWMNIPYFEGRADFLFTMSEIQETLALSKRPANCEVRVDASVFDRLFLINQSSYAHSYIFKETPEIRFIGGKVRQFKPGFPFTALILVYQPDGQKPDFRYRYVEVSVYCDTSRLVRKESSIPIPDDAVVRFTIDTTTDCVNYRLLAVLKSSVDSEASTHEQYIFRHYSPTGAYMRVMTSTEQPMVDRYMVFNVKTNFYAEQIHFLIMASGNIMHSDILQMPAGVHSKTFSLALSRAMAPVARIVVFFMKQDGELVTDSMTFSVNLLSSSSVNVKVMEGSDLTGKTVSGWVTGASPGSFALLSVMPFELYQRYGQKVMLEPNTILEELRTFESHAEQPLRHRWFNDSSDVPFAKYFPAGTLGPDANKTMNFSGLIMFTDSNYTKVTFWHTCNETLNADRAFPCYSSSHDECYGRRHICDGNFDCVTGVDEMNCGDDDVTESLPGYLETKFKFEFRHFIYDESWLWQEVYVKPFPNNRVPINTGTVPKLETAWAIGTIAIGRENGIQLSAAPALFASMRRLYIVLDLPKTAIWGEQIGARVVLHNRWDYWIEALVELQSSLNFEFIKVNEFGQVNNYAPDTIANVSVHSLVFLPASSTRMIYFPILPRKTGSVSVTFCARSFIGGECVTKSFSVSMNGVANSYHSPILLDLVSQSSLLSQFFHILPEQDFVEPEKRWRRFVPGSKTASFTIVGDIIGPAFSSDMPVGDTSNVVWKPHGSAESVLFNINWNVQMLHYLRITSQLETSTQARVLEFVNTQFARLTFYIDPDTGGIANFPEKFISETSTFLTAFGLFTLAETAFSEWQLTISIGTDVFEKLLKFLVSSQVTSGDEQLIGSFTDSVKCDLKYFDAYIKDTATSEEDRDIVERVPVTALAVIAASHSNIPNSLASLANQIVTLGDVFLRRHLSKIESNPLALAMTAYALTFDKLHGAKAEAISMLLRTARTDNHMYWANRRVRPLIREPNSAGMFLIKPRVEWPNDALSVQASAFGLLALFKTGSLKTDEALRANITRIVNFITETKNSPNGWISTQDTVFAVRALREVAQLDLNREIYQMRVEVTPSADASKTVTFNLGGSNLSVPQSVTYDNDDVWGEVSVKASGSGRAILQLNAQKSVENAFQVKNAADPIDPNEALQTFEFTCTPLFSGRNGSFLYLKTCARWVWTERSETSGLAVISFALPSGYQVSNYGLRNFVQASSVRGFRHAWIESGGMNLFFNNFTSTETTCVTLRLPRWFPVANTTIEQSCSVYEYFENDNGNFTIYSARTLQSNDICKVCGSFQCPYCPEYNSSSLSFVNCIIVAFAIIATVLQQLLDT